MRITISLSFLFLKIISEIHFQKRYWHALIFQYYTNVHIPFCSKLYLEALYIWSVFWKKPKALARLQFFLTYSFSAVYKAKKAIHRNRLFLHLLWLTSIWMPIHQTKILTYWLSESWISIYAPCVQTSKSIIIDRKTDHIFSCHVANFWRIFLPWEQENLNK